MVGMKFRTRSLSAGPKSFEAQEGNDMNRLMSAYTTGPAPTIVALLVLAVTISVTPMRAIGQVQEHLSHREVKRLIATATTSSDHLRLAAYYRAEAIRLRKRSKEHQEEATGYANRTIYEPKGEWLQHCKTFADSFGQAADEAESLASAHQKMAEQSR